MKYWDFIKNLTDAEFEQLSLAMAMRVGLKYLREMFPIDSIVKPRGDHTNHEWHVDRFDLSDDCQIAWVYVIDHKQKATGKFYVEDLFPDGAGRDSYWRINPISSNN